MTLIGLIITWVILEHKTLVSAFSDPRLSLMIAPSKCGPSAGGASCAVDSCCRPNVSHLDIHKSSNIIKGTCGTGGYFCDAPACLFAYGPACHANALPVGKSTS